MYDDDYEGPGHSGGGHGGNFYQSDGHSSGHHGNERSSRGGGMRDRERDRDRDRDLGNNVYAAGAQIAEPVKNFLLVFQHALRENNMFQINNIYETGFDKLTEQHFKTRPWPSVEDVEDIVGNDQVIIFL